jgi:hypothetical protein
VFPVSCLAIDKLLLDFVWSIWVQYRPCIPTCPIGRKTHTEGFAIALDVRFVTCLLPAVVLGLVLSAGARARDTGYVFVSNEKTNNIAVIDPKQDDKMIKWIPTSNRPRDMKFGDNRRLLYVACGDDDVIDVIDVAKLKIADHIPTGPSPEMFELTRDEKALCGGSGFLDSGIS